MWYLKACRACLATEGKLEKVNDKTRRIFFNATELQIEPGDSLPQYFCVECYAYIKKTMAFRRRSRRAHFVLKEIVLVKKQVSQGDILTVDRKKTNLISPLSYWNPEKNGAYYYSTSDAMIEEETTESDTIDDTEKEKAIETQTENVEKREENTTAVTDTVTPTQTNVLNYMLEQTQLKPSIRTYPAKSYNIKELKPSSAPALQNENIMLLAQPTDVKKKKVYGEFVKEESNVLNASAIVVDIKPDSWAEIEKEETETRQKEIDQALKEMVTDNNHNDEENASDDNNFDDVKPEDIDMEDIFKGLKEEEEENSDFEWQTLYNLKPIVGEKEKSSKSQKDSKQFETLAASWRRMMVKALAASNIKYLSLAEQIKVHSDRLQQEPFKSAKIKCQMCVLTFNNMDEIQHHVIEHNYKACFKHSCPVCSERFKTLEQCHQHCAHSHWYAYRCGACPLTHYNFTELTNCWIAHEREVKDSNGLNTSNKNLRKLFKIRPLKQENMGDTLKQWSDISGGLVSQPRGKYNCEKCKFILGGLVPWRKHMQQHEVRKLGQGRLECDVCGLTWPSRKLRSLTFHIKSRHMYTYTCKKCHNKFYNRNQALFHYDRCPKFVVQPEEKKAAEERLYCSMCLFFTTGGVAKLHDHQLDEHGYIRLQTEPSLHNPSLQCKQCRVFFCNKKYLAVHCAREGHGEVDEMESLCFDCGETLDSAESLSAHRALAHPEISNDHLKCVKCDKEFINSWNRNLHMREVHRWDDKYRLCELCGKLLSRSGFGKHRLHHKSSEIAERLYRCRFCEHKSFAPAPYVSHVLFNHTLKPYCCTVCGGRFQSRCDARDHILKNHAPCRPYECEACRRHFSHLDYLQEHCLKQHGVNIKKTDKSVFLGKRVPGKIYVYEHMKIDGSLIDESVLANASIEKCDYMEETFIPIDYKEAFFFDPTVDPNAPTKFDLPYHKRPRDTRYLTDDEKKDKSVKKMKLQQMTHTKSIMEYHEISQKTVRQRSSDTPKPTKVKIKGIKSQNQKTNTEPGTKETKYDYIGNVLESQDSPELKIETDSTDYKSEQSFDMPELNVEESAIQEFVENVGSPKMQTIEETVVEESVIPQEIVEEKEEMTLTEDVLGELVEHEGQFYVIIDGLLYKIESN